MSQPSTSQIVHPPRLIPDETMENQLKYSMGLVFKFQSNQTLKCFNCLDFIKLYYMHLLGGRCGSHFPVAGTNTCYAHLTGPGVCTGCSRAVPMVSGSLVADSAEQSSSSARGGCSPNIARCLSSSHPRTRFQDQRATWNTCAVRAQTRSLHDDAGLPLTY